MSQRLDLRSFQSFLLAKGYGARATKPTRREESRARLQRDLFRGRPRKPNATATEVNRFSSYDGEDYVAYSNGRIEKLDTTIHRQLLTGAPCPEFDPGDKKTPDLENVK